MLKHAIIIIAIAMSCGCAQPDAPEQRVVETREPRPTTTVAEKETPVSDRDAAKLSREFGLSGCSGVTRLRDVEGDGHFAASWRVREGERCFQGWSERQQRYSILEHLDVSQDERDRLPWLCGESGSHVAECASQGSDRTLLIEQPRGADFLLFRRITKAAK
ncbi:hypothetical protein [Sphingomonas gilva]|uniref:hypothetical protein n=1 Tax=Sphingomonas gilva TaxID=2305907 RepID=UPI0011C354C3|nr:hypothetical protein [Sphingomonas gilva]